MNNPANLDSAHKNPNSQNLASFLTGFILSPFLRGPDGTRTENSPRIGIASSFLQGFELVPPERRE